MARIAGRFARVEPRRRARAFLLGLLADLPRKNCWTIAAPAGHALIDRALYLPKSWTADAGRCQAAGIPEDTFFATKPKLARQMIGRAIDAGKLGWRHLLIRWSSWHRWTTLAMLALAFLTITTASEHATTPPPDGQIPLTRNETARLMTALLIKPARNI